MQADPALDSRAYPDPHIRALCAVSLAPLVFESLPGGATQNATVLLAADEIFKVIMQCARYVALSSKTRHVQ